MEHGRVLTAAGEKRLDIGLAGWQCGTWAAELQSDRRRADT